MTYWKSWRVAQEKRQMLKMKRHSKSQKPISSSLEREFGKFIRERKKKEIWIHCCVMAREAFGMRKEVSKEVLSCVMNIVSLCVCSKRLK